MRLLSSCVLALALIGCGGGGGSSSGGGGGTVAGGGSSGGGGGSSGPVDMFAANSVCGHPGDKGNSLGIGQYCTALKDCPSTAPICTIIGNSLEPANDQTYFCTATCTTAGSTTDPACGSGATCVKQGANLACVPDSCGSVAPPTNDGG